MPYKPMPRRKFEKWLKRLGWTMAKTGFDWSIYDQENDFVCTVIIQHPGENVVIAHSIRKFEKILKERDLL